MEILSLAETLLNFQFHDFFSHGVWFWNSLEAAKITKKLDQFSISHLFQNNTQ
jgi:hypothetical protein